MRAPLQVFAPWDASARSVLLFVGNPGAGKSTLLNALIGQPLFKAGVSFGGGLTEALQWVEHNKVTYGDTPGLSDMERREAAAKEITRALRKEGSYKLLFVCTLEEGRVRPSDVETITLVLQAIPADIRYGVIVNKLENEAWTALCQDSKSKMRVMACLNTGHRPTDHFFWYQRREDLAGKSNVLHIPDAEFLKFLREIPHTIIPAEKVLDVKPNLPNEDLQKLTNTLEALRKDQARMEQDYRDQIEFLRAQVLAQQQYNATLSRFENLGLQDYDDEEERHGLDYCGVKYCHGSACKDRRRR